MNKRLEQLMAAAEKTGQDYSKDIADLNAYASHLEQRRAEYAAGGMARMTSGQLRGLRSILEETIHIVKNENKLLGEEYQETIDTFADGMTKELREAKGTNFGNSFAGKVGRKLASYKLNTMNIERTFERMGGYVHGGYMEKAGKMLNDGQNKKTRLIVEGTSFFDNVTGPGSLKKMDRFSHELIDIGLRDDAGKAVKITREQAVALYFQCQNLQGLHHMTHGGLKVMNMEYAVKGDTEMANRGSGHRPGRRRAGRSEAAADGGQGGRPDPEQDHRCGERGVSGGQRPRPGTAGTDAAEADQSGRQRHV